MTSPRALDPRVIDIAVAAITGAVLIAFIATGSGLEESSNEPDALAYVLGVAMAVLLLARRSHPLGVLLGTALILQAYYMFNYPAIGLAVPLGVAVYTAVVAGCLRWSFGVVVAFLVEGVLFRSIVENEDLVRVLRTDMLAEGSLLIAAVLLGETVRSRRALEAVTRARLAQAEAEREREAERRVQEERRRVARDVHDVLAHTVAAITVQAGVASDALRDSPDEAEAALAAIRAQSREALAELRATVRLLREDGDQAPTQPQPGIAQVDDLVEVAAGAGVEVAVEVHGEPRPVPAMVDLTAYRVVQESLTNVVRHAGAERATVAIRFEPSSLALEVVDRGAGPRTPVNGSAGGGFGIVGMRERVSAIGGKLDAGPDSRGGFRVSARLPIGTGA